MAGLECVWECNRRIPLLKFPMWQFDPKWNRQYKVILTWNICSCQNNLFYSHIKVVLDMMLLLAPMMSMKWYFNRMLDPSLVDYFKGNWNVAKKTWKYQINVMKIDAILKPSCQIWCLSRQVKYFTNYPLITNTLLCWILVHLAKTTFCVKNELQIQATI
jgi:hypothetical protein